MNKNVYAAVGLMPTRETIYQAVCKAWEIPREDLMLHRRNREIVEPRQAAFYYLYVEMRTSPSLIAGDGDFNHSTVNHAVKVASNLLQTCKAFQMRYNLFLSLLK